LSPFDRKGQSTIRSPDILRTGARRLIAQAVEAEFETFLASNAELVLSDGRRRVVRHWHDPVRAIQTGIGPVEVQKPKARDRAASGARIWCWRGRR
jgi:putative transposase